MAAVFRSPFYAPRPDAEPHWLISTQAMLGGQNGAIQLTTTQVKFFGQPGQSPTHRWYPHYTYDVSEPNLWYPPAEWLNSGAITTTRTQVKFYGQPGQSPTRRWSVYMLPDDSTHWLVAFGENMMTNSTIRQPALNPFKVIKWQPYYNYDVADAGLWYPTLDNRNSNVLDAFVVQKFFGAGGQVPTYRWSRHITPDDSSHWLVSFGANMMTNSTIRLPTGNPFVTQPWIFHSYDDPSYWGNGPNWPPNANALNVPSNIISIPPFFTARPSDDTFWVGTPSSAKVNYFPTGNPFVTTRWILGTGYDDSSYWGNSPNWPPSANSLNVPPTPTIPISSRFNTTQDDASGWFNNPLWPPNANSLRTIAHNPFPTTRWIFGGYDDPPTWYPTPENMDADALQLLNFGPVKFQREWLFGYDDPAFWLGKSVQVPVLDFPTAKNPINVYRGLSTPPDDSSGWQFNPLFNVGIFTSIGFLPTISISAPNDPDDYSTWQPTTVRNQGLLTPTVTTPFVSQPWILQSNYDTGETFWVGQPKSTQLTIPQLFSGPVKFQREWLFGYDDPSGWQYLNTVPVRNLNIDTITQTPIAVNVPPWRFLYDDSSYWQGNPRASNLLIPQLSSGPVKFQREWLFGYDDPAYWQAGTQPASSKILIPQSSFGPVQFQREWLFGYDDASGWQYLNTVPVRNLSIYTITQVPIVVNVPPWRTLQDDPSYWVGKPASSNLLIPQLNFGPVKLQREWLFGYDDPAFWLGKSVQVPVLDFPTPAPALSGQRQWLFGQDDSSFWQGNPLDSKVLVPLLTAAGQVHNKQWLFGYDDPAYWLGQPRVSQLLIPIVSTAIPVQFQRQWPAGYDDPAYQGGAPRASILIPNLTFGPVKFQREWLFGYDDPAFWTSALLAPQRSRILIPILTAGGQVHNKQWPFLFGYDDPAFWLGHSVPNFGLITPPAPIFPFLNLPRQFWGDDHSFWVGKSFRSNTLAYPLLIIDPRFISAPNVLLPSNLGANRIVVATPPLSRNFIVRGNLAPNNLLPSNLGANRSFITTPKVTGMPYGNDLSVIDPVIEKVTLTFNFAPWLSPGVTITNVVSVTASVTSSSQVVDPNPQGIIFGPAVIGTSPLPPNAPGAAVLQQVAGCLAGVTYLLQCLVDTSDSQQLNLATHLPCQTLQ